MSSHLDDNIIPPSRQQEAPRSDMRWIGKSMKRVEIRVCLPARVATSMM